MCLPLFLKSLVILPSLVVQVLITAIVVLVCRTAGMISSFDLSAVMKVRGSLDTGCLSFSNQKHLLLQHGAVLQLGCLQPKRHPKAGYGRPQLTYHSYLSSFFLPSLLECLKFGVAGMIVLSPVTGRGPVCLSRSCGENIAAAAEAESRFNVGSTQETRHVSH